MNIWNSLFSLPENDDSDINDEINIPEAINAHIGWKVRLQKFIDGDSSEKLDPMLVCRDDLCTLGEWIHSSATQRFHAIEAFHTLRSSHAQFHYVAAKVITHVQEGDQVGAQALLTGEYAAVSHHVMMQLLQLNKPGMEHE